MIPEDYKKVAVVHDGRKDCFFALYDDLLPGDTVLVSGASEGKIMVISEIVSVEDVAARFNKKILQEVICKVSYDASAYEERVEKRKQLEDIKKKMDKRVEQLNEMQKYEMYTGIDEEIRQLYEAYKRILKGE